MWNKKGSGEKGRGQNSKLPPRFVKKQQQQAAALQAQSTGLSAQGLPQTVPVSLPSGQPPLPVQSQPTTNGSDFPGSVKVPPPSQPSASLGTELWENKMAAPSVLNDLSKKRECPTSHVFYCNMTFFTMRLIKWDIDATAIRNLKLP